MVKRYRQRMFYRVFFTYSTIIFIAMAAVFGLIWNYYESLAIQKAIDQQKSVLNVIKQTLEAQEDYVRQGVLRLYLDQSLIEDLVYAMQTDYQDYLHYRLNKFSESDRFMPYNFDIYIKNYFSRHESVVTARLISSEFEMAYDYPFEELHWRRLKEANFDGASLGYHRVSYPINNPVSLERLGTLEVYFTLNQITDYFNSFADPLVGNYFVVDHHGQKLFAHGDGKIPDNMSFEVQSKVVGSFRQEMIETQLARQSTLLLGSVVAKSELENIVYYRIRFLFLVVGMMVMAMVLPYLILKNYSQRIGTLVETMSAVERGDFEARVHSAEGNDDLGLIIRTFNSMLDRLDFYLKKVYFSKLKQTEAELAQLQAQINPHFLYNTLEAIRMKALAEGSRESATMIYNLSQLFRMSLRHQEWVTVHQECLHVTKYIELFMCRYADQLQFDLNIPKEIERALIVPFVLQPLVENYLMYGFRREATDNRLQVYGEKDEELVRIIIEDNGSGISEERLSQIVASLEENVYPEEKGIGLLNVQARLRLKFGNDFGLKLNSTLTYGTRIEITLPFLLVPPTNTHIDIRSEVDRV